MSVTGADGVPLCRVYLTSKLVTDCVKLAVVDRIPTHGIVLLGNDLAGDRMRPCPVVSPHPKSENTLQSFLPVLSLTARVSVVQVGMVSLRQNCQWMYQILNLKFSRRVFH